MAKTNKEKALETLKAVATKDRNRSFAGLYGYMEDSFGGWLATITDGHMLVLVGERVDFDEMVPRLQTCSLATGEVAKGAQFNYAESVGCALQITQRGRPEPFAMLGPMLGKIAKVFSSKLGFGAGNPVRIEAGESLAPVVLTGIGKSGIEVKMIAMPAWA